jgi:hypothetical protein
VPLGAAVHSIHGIGTVIPAACEKLMHQLANLPGVKAPPDRFVRCLIIAVALIAPSAVPLLYWGQLIDNGWFPRCALYQLTGIHCPFCGGTRCAHALLHGDLPQALAWHPLAVVMIPAAAVWLYWAAWRVWRKRPVPTVNPPLWLIWTGLAFLLLFGVLRNLPFYPFELLAPHRIN